MSQIKDKVKGLKYELSITVPYSEFEQKTETKISEYAKTAKIQGFRTGHAPVSLIKQKYGDAFDADCLNELINETIFKYIDDKKLKITDRPSVNIETFEKGKDIKFTANFEVFPELEKVVDLQKLTITKKVLPVKDEDVEKALKDLTESRRETEALEKERPSQKGDIAIIDFEGFIDNKAFPGGKGSKYPLELGSKSFIEGFEDQLIGKNKDDKVDVNVQFPKDYHVKEFAGKDALFKVKIIDIRQKKVPTIDDNFAKELGRKDLSELRENIKQMQTEHYDNLSKSGMRDEVFKAFSKIKIDIPESLVKREYEYMTGEKAAEDLANSNEAKAEENSNKKEKELKAEAEKRVKLSLILNAIGKEGNVQVSHEDVQNYIMAEVQKQPQMAQQIIDYYTKNQNAMTMLRAELYETKVLEYIFSKVKINEKTVKDQKDLMEQ